MRWQGQELGVADDNALPGMEKLDGLVRSVTTPEFAGITFHEVAAKSALNHVPRSSSMPFDWTINPYRGCTHACVYCVSPDTLVLRADGDQVPIRDVMVGDEIIGTERQGSYRRYVRTTVKAKWPTRKRAYRITLADGTEITASADHRFLTDRGWKYVQGAADRPGITALDRLQGPATAAEITPSGPAAQKARDITPIRIGAGRSDVLSATRTGTAVKTTSDLSVVSVEDLGYEIEMVDITTGTGDFIANGVISHNCFARGTHEYLDLDAGKDFDSQIVVKVNVDEVLRRELAKPSWKREHVALGTNTDPYQRAEGRYTLMPGISTALAESGTPFSILTKGSLLRRDLPLLKRLHDQVPISIAMSIAVYDDELQQAIEPGTPTAQARLDTVRAATDAGFSVSVFMMPVLPHLTDSPEALDAALARVKAAGASRVVHGALHLRPGVKPWFMRWLAREHPELLPAYRGLYPGASVNAPQAYRTMLSQRIRPLIRSHRLDGRADGDPWQRPAFATAPAPARIITTARGRAAAKAPAPEPARLF
jgi:DNA repair photolyase